MGLYEIKTLGKIKESSKRMDIPHNEKVEIFAGYISHKGLYRIFKELPKLNAIKAS